MTQSINNDFILIQMQKDPAAEANQRKGLSHYSTTEPIKEAQKLRDFPIRWLVDHDRRVTQIGANDEIYLSSSPTETCQGPSCGTRAVIDEQDEL